MVLLSNDIILTSHLKDSLTLRTMHSFLVCGCQCYRIHLLLNFFDMNNLVIAMFELSTPWSLYVLLSFKHTDSIKEVRFLLQ